MRLSQHARAGWWQALALRLLTLVPGLYYYPTCSLCARHKDLKSIGAGHGSLHDNRVAPWGTRCAQAGYPSARYRAGHGRTKYNLRKS